MSNNRCILPWIAVDRNPKSQKGELTFSPCCYFDTKVKYDTVEQYWNGDEIRKIRQAFMRNEKHPGCKACWQAEDNGLVSLRQSANSGRWEEFKHRTVNDKCNEPPAQLKYNVGNQCNLACRMCVPNSSSKVKKVWDILGKTDKFVVDSLSWYDYIRENYKSIRYLDITGGEPFYHKNTKKILQFMIEKKVAKDVTLYITTNLTLIDQSIVDILKKFKEVVIRVSIDAVGKRQEYIRPGLNWEKFMENIKLVKSADLNIVVNPTISVLSMIHYNELEEWCVQNGITLSQQASVVVYPNEMAPHNLPSQLHHLVPKKFQKFLINPIDADSLNFVRQLDTIWKTNIVEYMPEWQIAYDSLHWKNFDYLKKLDYELEKYVK